MSSKPPNRLLTMELDDLRRASHEFWSDLDEHNYLPDDFPIEQCQRICKTLSGLANGSAEGCRLPLEHAIVRLSEIRGQQFIVDPDQQNQAETDLPKLQRGDSLDRSLALLISAATTSLDAYRQQLRKEIKLRDEEDYLGVSFANASENADARRLVDANAALDEFGNQLRVDENGVGDRLSRDIADVQNLANATRTELHSRPIIRKWLRILSKGTKTAALAARGTGIALKKALDLGVPLYRRWEEMWGDFFEFGVTQTELWADEIITLSEKLDAEAKAFTKGQESKLARTLGIAISVRGQWIANSEDGRVFQIHPEEKPSWMRPEEMIEFTPEPDTNGHPLATKISPDKLHIILEDKFLHKNTARPLLEKTVLKRLSKKPVHYKRISNWFRKLNVRPSHWYKILGFNTPQEFIDSIEGVSTQQFSDRVYYASKPIDISPISVDEFLEWALIYISTLPNEMCNVGELASEANDHFGMGIVPASKLMDVSKFSEPLIDDERFDVSGSIIRLASGKREKIKL